MFNYASEMTRSDTWSRFDPAAMEELAALLQRESRDGYGRIKIRRHSDDHRDALTMRREMCDLFYLIVDHYKFDREVVGIALNYFDRYMFQQPSQYLKRREKVQLVGVASIFVAIKAHSISEEHRTETRARALGHLLRDYFEPKEVTDMEASLFQTLDWQLNPPTMHQFAIIYYMLHPLGKFCKESTLYLYDAARYQAELVAFHPSLLEKFTPSVLAYAAVLNAQENVGEILWPVLKENWLSLMSQPADLVSLDPTQVKEAQTALEEVCPHLPGMDVFEAARQVSSSDGCQDTQRVPSPTNITHY